MTTRVTDNNYEAMVIFNAAQDEAAIKALIEKLEKILVDGGAEIKDRSDWGRRRLAYPIQKKNEGYYYIFYFALDNPTATLEQFERTCRFDENIMRQMVVRVPLKKRGEPIKQIVPTPGHLADYKFEPRRPRRRPPRPDRNAESRDSGENGSDENKPVDASKPAEAAKPAETAPAASDAPASE